MVADALRRNLMLALSLQHNRWIIALDGVLLAQLKAQTCLETYDN